ncbi:MarR family transcriptional regulator [Paenibacillus antibioticophila]|uniref:MarR family transcriptional regulator n=1 Tax=Paenibacillus antibioticophila TaxID=1274374 RepID=A0A919XZV3_9BACL|nr:MarR family transcriptional regulator [Paenibacillus antibioticophila]GIO39633.1 MarR family transcriptional regulator [Paenibacillus antibioticophila]
MNTSKVYFPTEPPTPEYLLEILFKTTHSIHSQFEAQLSAQDVPAYLTGPRMRFLKCIEEAGKIKMSDLATKLGIKKRTVTQFVDALEKENVIVRIPDPNDRRATLIQITETAEPLIKKTGEAMIEAASRVLASFSSESRSHLLCLLYQLADVKESNDDMN